jgi:hypothetical protein
MHNERSPTASEYDLSFESCRYRGQGLQSFGRRTSSSKLFPIWADIEAHSGAVSHRTRGGGRFKRKVHSENETGSRVYPPIQARTLIRIIRFTIWRICLTHAAPCTSPK